jgi:hypothetical protein
VIWACIHLVPEASLEPGIAQPESFLQCCAEHIFWLVLGVMGLTSRVPLTSFSQRNPYLLSFPLAEDLGPGLAAMLL